MKYKVYNAREFERLLKKNGYKLSRQTGDHIIYEKNNFQHISVPMSYNPMVLRRLIKENNLKE